MKKPYVISEHIDYVRFLCASELDAQDIVHRLSYVELRARKLHSVWSVDITGTALESIRLVEPVVKAINEIGRHRRISRLDVAIDVYGVNVKKATTWRGGTCILNQAKLETVYSHNLRDRGDKAVFARAYDAVAASHYPAGGGEVTRLEVEFKGYVASELTRNGVDKNCLFAMARYALRSTLQTKIDLSPSRVLVADRLKRLEPRRARFYRRYGRNIIKDVESYGFQAWLAFVHAVQDESDTVNSISDAALIRARRFYDETDADTDN